MTHFNNFIYAPWPWRVKVITKYRQPVYYIYDARDNVVARLDGPVARQHSDLLMEMASCYFQNKLKQQKTNEHRTASIAT